MNEATALIELQAQALIDGLSRESARACERETDVGAAQARELCREARHAATRLVREAITEERAHLEATLGQARAAAETRRRHAEREAAARAVADGWLALPEQLLRLWHDADARRRWCHAAIDEAARRLQRGRWTVRLAPGLEPVELEALGARLRHVTGMDLDHELATDAALQAGLAIVRAGATLDATPRGLLGAREAIEARLHAAWLGAEPEPRDSTDGPPRRTPHE